MRPCVWWGTVDIDIPCNIREAKQKLRSSMLSPVTKLHILDLLWEYGSEDN